MLPGGGFLVPAYMMPPGQQQAPQDNMQPPKQVTEAEQQPQVPKLNLPSAFDFKRDSFKLPQLANPFSGEMFTLPKINVSQPLGPITFKEEPKKPLPFVNRVEKSKVVSEQAPILKLLKEVKPAEDPRLRKPEQPQQQKPPEKFKEDENRRDKRNQGRNSRERNQEKHKSRRRDSLAKDSRSNSSRQDNRKNKDRGHNHKSKKDWKNKKQDYKSRNRRSRSRTRSKDRRHKSPEREEKSPTAKKRIEQLNRRYELLFLGQRPNSDAAGLPAHESPQEMSPRTPPDQNSPSRGSSYKS